MDSEEIGLDLGWQIELAPNLGPSLNPSLLPPSLTRIIHAFNVLMDTPTRPLMVFIVLLLHGDPGFAQSATRR
jgi:hypothetical protein